jgi:hypothetical protein
VCESQQPSTAAGADQAENEVNLFAAILTCPGRQLGLRETTMTAQGAQLCRLSCRLDGWESKVGVGDDASNERKHNRTTFSCYYILAERRGVGIEIITRVSGGHLEYQQKEHSRLHGKRQVTTRNQLECVGGKKRDSEVEDNCRGWTPASAGHGKH